MEGWWGHPWCAPKWTKIDHHWCLRSLGHHHVVRCFPSSSHSRGISDLWAQPFSPNLVHDWLCVHLINLILSYLWLRTNSKHFCYAMLWGPFWFILVYFGPFWYTSWMTPPPLYDWFWLLSSFKCPFYPEKGHISDSGKFETLLHCHAILTIWIKFESFWSILVHLMGDPTTPSWLVPTPIPFQVSILSRNGSY